ncbi:MAG TPA: DUF4118 domain-containing protein [Reyranella sp.]|nr:DUF4118 domain-containing protein [Reyranella sp.]
MPLSSTLRRLPSLRHLPFALRWAGAAGCVALAFGVRMALFGPTAETPFLFFIPAICFAAVFFDASAGIFATALSAVVAVYFFIVPIGTFVVERPPDVVNLGLFVLIGGFISLLVESLKNAHVGLARTLEKEREARERAEAGERDRELLLVELRQRTKEDLQRIAGLIDLQAQHSPETAPALRQAAHRIRLISRLHGRLARSNGHALVDVPALLEDLVADLRDELQGVRPIGIFLHAEPIMLSVARTGSLALIVNELVTNAMKHAFPDDDRQCQWAVRIGVAQRNGDLYLTVTDNGRGIAPDAHPGAGLKLVRALTAQLEGHFESMPMPDGTAGTCNTLRLPM